MNDDVRLFLETEIKKSNSTVIEDRHEEAEKVTKKLFKNVGLKGLRKKAGWGNETLALILKQNF